MFLFCTVSTISLIVAVAENLAIGKENKLLWEIKDDLKLFMKTTSGHAVIHGRKSFESIGKPLPNRSNILITRNKHYKVRGAFVVNSLDEALTLAEKLEFNGEIFILGGAEIYRQSLDKIDKLYISNIDASFSDADAYFPEINWSNWVLESENKYPQKRGKRI